MNLGKELVLQRSCAKNKKGDPMILALGREHKMKRVKIFTPKKLNSVI